MRCSRAQRYIDLQLDGELNPRYQQSLTQHLAKCPVCRAWAAEAPKLQLMLSVPLQPEFPAWVHANIMDKVHRLDNKRPSVIQRFKLAPATAALAVIISFWAGAQVGIQSINYTAKTETSASSTLLSSNTITFGENSLIDSYETGGSTNE